MKVKIGKHKKWIGPYQISSALCFWAKKEKDEYGFDKEPDWVFDFGTWLSGGEKKESWLMKLCQWIESKRKRTIKIKIDYYDTWNMGHNLAYIILPMLKQLKEQKQGSPVVDDEDVPEEIRSTNAPPKKEEYDTDEHFFKRWDYVIDEMIFAFEHMIDDSWEENFSTGEMDHIWIPVDKEGNVVPKEEAKYYQMGEGPNHTYECDYDGMKVVHDRMQNGFRLFGKYYQGLWT